MPQIERRATIPEYHELLTAFPPHLAQLLYNKKKDTLKKAQDFLHPKFEDTYDPFLLKDMSKAIERLFTALERKECITIYADYDADGIPAAVILNSLFEKIGYDNYHIYIPHRHDEGYGIHLDALQKIKKQGTQLIISVDVGITAHDAGVWCKQEHIDLIITDHHLPEINDTKEVLPEVYAIINPKQKACQYPDSMLCGSGVAFKLVQAFLTRYGNHFNVHEGWEKWLLDMVGIATISDMVPLENENRIFAYYGLKVIQKTQREGLKKLIWDSGIHPTYLNEEDIAFGISPKINAASRMGHPEDALKVFLARDEVIAQESVKYLNELNNKRKILVANTLKQAYSKLEKREHKGVIVVGSSEWQAGILGLVASKLVEKYGVPVFVWSEEQDIIKGSCRSTRGINLMELMQSIEPESFIQYGGHKEAGGFSCEKKQIHFLEERLTKKIPLQQFTDQDVLVYYDDVLNIDEINETLYRDIQKLGPFGVGNEKPIFLIQNLVPLSVGPFGKQKEHFEIKFKNNTTTMRAICFFKQPEDFSRIPETGQTCSLLGHIEQSYFLGKKELRIRIIDCV